MNGIGSGSRENRISYPAGAVAYELSPAEVQAFKRNGWIGVFPLLAESTVAELSAICDRVADQLTQPGELKAIGDGSEFAKRPWFKSAHSIVSELYDLACRPEIVRRLVPLLGPDIIAWGVSAVVLPPGDKHRWHVDVEHRKWPGVTVYIGMKNISAHSTLQVISGSHIFEEVPQELGIKSKEQALKAARRRGSACELLTVDLKEGEFFMFDGRLWHGSENRGKESRTAILMQYSSPEITAEIPANWDEPVRWIRCQPPCILVCGEDKFGKNRLIERPRPQA